MVGAARANWQGGPTRNECTCKEGKLGSLCEIDPCPEFQPSINSAIDSYPSLAHFFFIADNRLTDYANRMWSWSAYTNLYAEIVDYVNELIGVYVDTDGDYIVYKHEMVVFF